jgi:hypothetical protein
VRAIQPTDQVNSRGTVKLHVFFAAFVLALLLERGAVFAQQAQICETVTALDGMGMRRELSTDNDELGRIITQDASAALGGCLSTLHHLQCVSACNALDVAIQQVSSASAESQTQQRREAEQNLRNALNGVERTGGYCDDWSGHEECVFKAARALLNDSRCQEGTWMIRFSGINVRSSAALRLLGGMQSMCVTLNQVARFGDGTAAECGSANESTITDMVAAFLELEDPIERLRWARYVEYSLLETSRRCWDSGYMLAPALVIGSSFASNEMPFASRIIVSANRWRAPGNLTGIASFMDAEDWLRTTEPFRAVNDSNVPVLAARFRQILSAYRETGVAAERLTDRIDLRTLAVALLRADAMLASYRFRGNMNTVSLGFGESLQDVLLASDLDLLQETSVINEVAHLPLESTRESDRLSERDLRLLREVQARLRAIHTPSAGVVAFRLSLSEVFWHAQSPCDRASTILRLLAEGFASGAIGFLDNLPGAEGARRGIREILHHGRDAAHACRNGGQPMRNVYDQITAEPSGEFRPPQQFDMEEGR